MKLLAKVNDFIREMKPDWKFKLINGSSDKISVILEKDGVFELIAFEFVNGVFVASVNDYKMENENV